MREKKKKNKGDLVSVRLSSNESNEILAWVNNQANLMDSIRFLIEKEIITNGNRNLQSSVPSYREFEWVIKNIHSNSDEVKSYIHSTYQLGLASSSRDVQVGRSIDRDLAIDESMEKGEKEEQKNPSYIPFTVDLTPIEKKEDNEESKKSNLQLTEKDAEFW